MKKIIFLQLIILILAANIFSQVKVNFKLANPVANGSIMSFDVIAIIPAGQQWRVGPTCIRINYWTTPNPGAVTVHEDNPATNANVNISNNSSYDNMTTTRIMNDSTISLNIDNLLTTNSYHFASGGTYTLGSIRFDILNTVGCVNTTILPISAVFDSLTPLSYISQWTKTDTGCVPIGIDVRQISKIPTTYSLYQNYPNPFNPSTKIRFEIPKSENVKIEIFDEIGRVVETLLNMDMKPGVYEATWNAGGYASGLYFYRLTAGNFVQTNKMLLIK